MAKIIYYTTDRESYLSGFKVLLDQPTMKITIESAPRNETFLQYSEFDYICGNRDTVWFVMGEVDDFTLTQMLLIGLDEFMLDWGLSICPKYGKFLDVSPNWDMIWDGTSYLAAIYKINELIDNLAKKKTNNG